MNTLPDVKRFTAMSTETVEVIRAFEAECLKQPQVPIRTDHVFHAGVYARTITIPAGVALTGALIKRSTLLIVAGNCRVFTGEAWVELSGTHVIPASAGRKQVFIALSDTHLTMLFATAAKTIEDAENEFTDEAAWLFSRGDDALNTLIITGE
jgi:hypothetical protein